jgi:glyoxylase-like metal-dependent hydrolase (beta-lactamase superfamily II)
MSWSPVLPDVLRWRDSCNVYAVLGEESALIVDAGTGAWLDDANQLPVPPGALALTHFFRDHSAGAARAAQMEIPVYVPEGEQAIFADAAEHFRRRLTYMIYDNIWDLFAPVESIPVEGLLRDYERIQLAGIELRVVPLPGATPTQVGLLLRTPQSGRLVAFCGETIHSPGRVPRIAPLQYDYCDSSGSVNVSISADHLARLDPELLLPSLGEPIEEAPAQALQTLRENLRAYCWNRPTELIALEQVGKDRVQQLSASVWRSTQSQATSHFIVGPSGRALVIDYGYSHIAAAYVLQSEVGWLMPTYPFPEARRPLLHSLDALREQAGVEELAAVIPTHFHDDHTCGIPLLQRLFDVPCWVPESFARLLADPAGHRFPCNWPRPTRVDRVLPLDETLVWDGIEFHFAPMSGHTRFSALIGWEVDGVRYAHTGDQYFPQRDGETWCEPAFGPTFVYRNGAFLDSYRRSAEWVTAFRPDVVVSGHWDPLQTDDRYFEQLAEFGREYERRHLDATAIGAEQPHFGLDGMAGWIWPYRTHLPEPGPIELEVTIRNPLPHEAMLRLALSGPESWVGSTAQVRVAGRAEATVPLTITPSGPCRRQPVVVELHADGRPFGQVLEALVTIGGASF